MRWLALEAGDAATWGSTVVTFGMACYAIAQGVGQKRDLRRQNELQSEASQLQRRQIETAERRTLIMEQMLARLTAAAQHPQRQTPSRLPGGYGAVADTREPEPEHRAQPDQGLDYELEPAVPRRSRRTRPLPPEDAEEASSEASEEAYPPEWGESRSEPEACPQCGLPREASEPFCDVCRYNFLTHTPTTLVPAATPPVTHVPDITPAGTAQLPEQTPFTGQPRTPWRPETLEPSPTDSPWRLERFGQHVFALRNLGPSTLTGVRVSRANLPSSARGVPESAVVRAGETAEFAMAATRGQPVPARLRVSWDGQSGEVDVPVPES